MRLKAELRTARGERDDVQVRETNETHRSDAACDAAGAHGAGRRAGAQNKPNTPFKLCM